MEAIHGMVWIFSGIAHWEGVTQTSVLVALSWWFVEKNIHFQAYKSGKDSGNDK